MDPPRPHPDRPLVVAYGLGVNSTAMLVEFVPHLILFTDTGGEKPETYQYMARSPLFPCPWLEDTRWTKRSCSTRSR